MKKEILIKKLQSSNIGKRYWRSDINHEKVDQSAVHIKKVREFCDNIGENLDKGLGLTLIGDYGTGKTSLAAYIAKKAFAINKTVYFLESYDLQKIYFEKEKYDSSTLIFDRLTAVDLLIIDDLGANYESDFCLTLLESLIRKRYNNLKSTIITTNEKNIIKKTFNAGCIDILTSTTEGIMVKGLNWRKS